jgi:hypothetical protein
MSAARQSASRHAASKRSSKMILVEETSIAVSGAASA